MPFGGYKSSGLGRELVSLRSKIDFSSNGRQGSYALENYCEVKSIHVNIDMPAPEFKL